MRIPTVWIRNKRTREKRKVNAIDYATDLGIKKFRNWELLSEQHGDKPETLVDGNSLGISNKISSEEQQINEQLATRPTTRRTRKRTQQAEVFDREIEE